MKTITKHEMSIQSYETQIDLLKGKIYKILPMYEQEVETIKKYVVAVLDEFLGFKNLYPELETNKIVLTDISLLTFLMTEEYDHTKCKSYVLTCVNNLDKLKTENR